MSLDVYLKVKREEPTDADRVIALLMEHGFTRFADEISARHECGDVTVYEGSISSFFGEMAVEAGVYQPVWYPEDNGIKKASQLIDRLRAGVNRMESRQKHFRQWNGRNDWETSDRFRQFLTEYLHACERHPEADVYAY